MGLFAALVPLGILYIIWILATLMGWIKGQEPETIAERLVRHLAQPSEPVAEQVVPIEKEWLEANKPANFASV